MSIDIEEIEAKREEAKERFGLDDEQFNILIRNVILNSFDKLGIKLSVDDPIFAVVLAQKNVMDYYSLMITNSLNNLPKQIGNVVDAKIEDLGDTINAISEAFDNELEEFKKSFSSQTLELNNQIIINFNKFIDKKLEDIKLALTVTDTPISTKFQKSPFKVIFMTILLFTMLNFVTLGITLYLINNQKDTKIEAYQMGLFKGFEQVRKTLSKKDSDNVESIIIQSIDKELKAKSEL